jgi:subtilisin family serine protease
VTADLRDALSRAGPAERIPVLIEVVGISAPQPVAPDRDLRAAEHASNLADLYASSLAQLRRSVAADLALDLQAGVMLWIGGAIAAELTPAQIDSLVVQPGVRRLYYDGLVEVDLAGGSEVPPPLLWAPGLPVATQDPEGGLPWGLEVIGAPELWAAGATGQGTVVAIIDSGVDGEHPLLWRKWRGLSTSAAEAWFDPWGLSATPVDDDATGLVGHGTLVATVAVGSLEPGDTLITISPPGWEVVEGELEVVTGVAPAAEWMAANAFENFGGEIHYTRLSVLLQSMQWALDPDGDPATVSDVPDVVNNSWGFQPGGCDGVFDRAIDALELAGVPVVFAAGNRPSGFEFVASPAERADLLLNAFAVGAAERRADTIRVAEISLGGPSPCAPGAVKPEIVAPGQTPRVRKDGQRSVVLVGLMSLATSWAAPHAAGALALLSGLNPAASANDLKDALFSTALDLPPPGLDNRSGAGLLDLPAAADRIGGLGGVRLMLAGWVWDSARATLSLRLHNGGAQAFPGGSAELRRRTGGTALARAGAPAIPSKGRGEIVFEDVPADLASGGRLTLHLEGGGAALDLPILLRASTATSLVLTDGEVRISLDAQGRLGRIAGPPGFEFLGGDWLTAGSFLFGRGGSVSDAAYVDVRRRQALKSNPVGSDTDWQPRDVTGQATAPDLAYGDQLALRPLGASVESWAELVAIGDSAAFLVVTNAVTFAEQGEPALAGLLLDWDLGARDSVSWDSGLGASVMTAADSSGPWIGLTTAQRAPTTHAAVPLGTPVAGEYSGGELSEPEGFAEQTKARYLRLGGLRSSNGSVTDWAQLVGVGPLRSRERIAFLIAAGRSREALDVALDSARSYAIARGDIAPPTAVSSGLRLLPAYPNPFNPSDVEAVSLPFLVSRGSDALEARVEIYTVSGRLIHSERRTLTPDSPIEPFRWSGRLANGESAASGVYGYVIRVGGQRGSGKFVLLK